MRRRAEEEREGEDRERAGPIPAPAHDLDEGHEAPSLESMVRDLQGQVGNRALARLLAPAPAFSLAASGASREVPHRRRMEQAFGMPFHDVRVATGGPAAHLGLAALGARAATGGNRIVFGEDSPSPELVAHELAHVVQQRRGASGGGAGAYGDAERAADRASAAVARGEAAPDVGLAPAGLIQRAPVSTVGGDWDTTTYSATEDGTGGIGASISLKFTPTGLVEANAIGLTQSVKTLKSTTAGGAVDTPSTPSPRKSGISLTTGDKGRAIDQGDPGDADTLPNTNPLYPVENTPGNVSASLTDVPATPGFGSHASRVKKMDGSYAVTPGVLSDGPSRQIEFPGQEWRQTFEVTALALDGALANMYLGSVEWGWRCNDKGKVTLDPDPIRVVREGPPTAEFMEAAKVWNAASFTDPSDGTAYATVDLPVTAVDPGSLSTKDLVDLLAKTRGEVKAMPGGAATARKYVEQVALERELAKRNVKVHVRVNETEDWIGSDNVYVRATGITSKRTPERKLNNGQSADFLIPVGDLLPSMLPLVMPIRIEVFDADWPDADDLIVDMSWATPYASLRNTASMDDADYDVEVTWEK